MSEISKLLVASTFSGVLWAQGGVEQAPSVVPLEIEWENAVNYYESGADPARFVTSPTAGTVMFRNFWSFISLADIVSVNGKPAKGMAVSKGPLIMINANPSPGQAIGDIGRVVASEYYLEVLGTDGTRIGSIMAAGFGLGPPPPGVPAGPAGNWTVVGGTGAFLGARGMMMFSQFAFRPTSVEEDPANRRIHGGGRGRFLVYLIPMMRPDVVSINSGPAVFHADFSPVTSARPARSGETLIVRATGLGPTRPGLTPGVPFSLSPVQEVNSPVEIAVNGRSAEVLNKIGWPGTTDTYRLDFRVPDGIAPGTARIQITAGFIQGREVGFPVE